MSRVLVLAVAVFAVLAGPAYGALGENFRLVAVNGPGQQAVPAAPDADHYWWAGACDTGSAPAVGDPIPGGIGSRPFTTIGVLGDEPAPVTPAHCVDPGGATQSSAATWAVAPEWRQAPVAQAGAHPDGTAAFAFAKNTDGELDNIVVDLPPGFVGDPNAIPKCSAQEFAKRPQQCPPQSQVGVLDINLGSTGLTGNWGGSANLHILPVYNLEPRQGNTAELGLVYLSQEGKVTARLVAKARTNGDFGVTTFIGQIPAALPLFSQTITIWGVPWEAANDLWRVEQGFEIGFGVCQGGASRGIPTSGLPVSCQQSYDRSWGPIRPFISNPTGGSFTASDVGGCDGSSPRTRLMIDAYQQPGAFVADGTSSGGLLSPRDGFPDLTDPDWKVYDTFPPALEGCEKLGFEPDIDFAPTTSVADGASGLDVDLAVPQNREPPFDPPPAGAGPADVAQYVADATAHWRSDAGLAAAHLKDTVVTLPAGVAVNPSGATGLEACSDAQIGLRDASTDPPLFNNGDPFNKDGGVDGAECPDGSKIGTAEVDTPLLDEPLTGEVVLGQPKSTDPRSGQMLRLFIVVRDPDRGLVAKIYGSTVADGTVGEGGSGQLTATFVNNPRVPFERLRLQFKDGPRGVLRNPQRCGAPAWSSVFTPWSQAPGATGQTVADSGAFRIDAGCRYGFAPSLTAGVDDSAARGHSRFAFEFTRPQGDQWLGGLTAKLPRGLLASVRDLPLCTNAQANAGACPLASQIGIVDAAAGSGDPFVLEQKGRVYLTEGYKGGQYGLAVKIRPIAGPFRGPMELSTIVVRQAIHVDRRTAQVTAISDPFPRVWHGVPLAVRRVLVHVDRARFMLNPSGCAAKQVRGDLSSADGALAPRTVAFHTADCARLSFRPRLALRLTGRRQTRTGRHPGIRAVVRQNGIPEAGIKRAAVRLPASLALDVNNAQALCEFDDGTKPDLENHCPQGSIVGRARAKTPLLNKPLVGNVYFVKNVRIDKRTGNTIRTLPMIIVALRGEIAINLRGNSRVSGRKLVNTFTAVPDAPVTRFNLNIRGGRNGILAVTRTRRSLINICTAGRQTAQAKMNAHNGRHHDRNITIRKPCPKRRTTPAKICRKQTNTRPALKRCVAKIKRKRAKQRAASKTPSRQTPAARG